MRFFPFQNVIAKLFVCVACVGIIIGTLLSVPSSKDVRMGRFQGFSSLYIEV